MIPKPSCLELNASITGCPRDAVAARSHINEKELATVYIAGITWSHEWKDRSIVFITANTVVQCAVNSGRSKNATVMYFLRQNFWLSIQYNFVFISAYIPSNLNIICDALNHFTAKDSFNHIRCVDTTAQLCCNFIFQP